jgi:hypothetical protein
MIYFLKSKMHGRPMNLASGVIQVPKLLECTSGSPNLVIGSHEVQISIIDFKPPTWPADCAVTWL